MASIYFRRGTRTFVVGSVLAILVAILHTTTLLHEPPVADYRAATDAMRAAKIDAGPFHTNLYKVFESVWIQVGAFMLILAGKNFLLLAVVPMDAAARVIRVISFFDAAAYACLAGMFVYYQVPPPLISYAVLAVAFFAAGLMAGRSAVPSK